MNRTRPNPIIRAWRFVTEGVWDLDPGSFSSVRGLAVKALRATHLMFRGFRDDDCPLHASALTLSSLMALVPILALSLALARAFGDEETGKVRMRNAVAEWTRTFERVPVESVGGDGGVALGEQIDGLIVYCFDRVDQISFKTLGSVGLVLLVWMVVQVLGSVEAAFNRVWGVRKGRSVWRRFTDYLSVLFVLPLLILAASSVPVADIATRHLGEGQAELLRTLLDSGLLKGMLMVVFSTLSFGFLIIFMPNTTVKARAALSGGFVAALLFLGWLRLCAAFQVGVARYGAIYGGFAVVPIILAWAYVSWEIVLFGAEAAFAVQNCTTYRLEGGAAHASVRARLVLALSVVVEAARGMRSGSGGFSPSLLAKERGVPVRFLNDVVDVLVGAGLLAEVAGDTGCFVLLRSPETLKARDVVDAVIGAGVGPAELGLKEAEAVVAGAVELSARRAGGADITISELAEESKKSGE
ncbi:MAG: YihY family inner membrane protein [Lentisphaerae bacterium]|nr:YihY family inner membrane protein [Lentisphaerota bacterium]